MIADQAKFHVFGTQLASHYFQGSSVLYPAMVYLYDVAPGAFSKTFLLST